MKGGIGGPKNQLHWMMLPVGHWIKGQQNYWLGTIVVNAVFEWPWNETNHHPIWVFIDHQKSIEDFSYSTSHWLGWSQMGPKWVPQKEQLPNLSKIGSTTHRFPNKNTNYQKWAWNTNRNLRILQSMVIEMEEDMKYRWWWWHWFGEALWIPPQRISAPL